MNRIFFYFISVIIAIYPSCHADKKILGPDLFISFNVDSIRIYDAKNIPKDIFIFSPLVNKDKIWTTGTNPNELDLKTGLWSPLTNKFGNQKERLHLNPESIWKDNFTKEIYIGNFENGLIRFHPEKETVDFYKLRYVTELHPSKKNIVIGTVNGLFFLNRNENKLNIAKNFPIDIRVNSIQELSNDTLSINYRYYYHLPTNKFGEKFTNNYVPEPEMNYNYASAYVKSKLPNGGAGYHEFRSNGIIWYYNEGELYYSKNSIEFFKFPLFPKGYVRHLLEDQKYLYVMFNDFFVIFNKNYLFENSIIHDVENSELLQLEYMRKWNDLNSHDMEFNEYLAKAINLYKDKKYALYSNIEYIPSRLEYYNYEKGVNNLNSILENDSIPEIFKYNILKGLCRNYTTSAKLDSALIYFELIKKLFHNHDDYCIQTSYPCVVKVKILMDSIKTHIVAPDQKLFFEANALSDLIGCSCWFGESWLNYSIVEEKYSKLLTNFQTSIYADKAEYWLINNNYFDGEGGGYSLSDIPKIKKFINKYPNSDLVPELIMNVAYSYSVAYSENIDDMIRNMEKAIEELRLLQNNYQLDSNQLAHVLNDLGYYEREKIQRIYTLTIVPLKTAYEVGEDIEVEISIANNSSIPRSLNLYENWSYVSFQVLPEKNVKFIPLDKDDGKIKTVTIKRGVPLKQKLILNRFIRHWSGALGRFNFEEEGLYDVSFSLKDKKLHSPQFKIYVKK